MITKKPPKTTRQQGKISIKTKIEKQKFKMIQKVSEKSTRQQGEIYN